MDRQQYLQMGAPGFWKATFALSIGAFLIFSNLHMSQPLLPLFSREFGVSPATASLSISLTILTLSVFLLVFGPISDAMGRKNIMSLGLIASSILSILIFFAPNFFMLLFLRAVQGIFLASLPAIAYAYIGEEFDHLSISAVIGIYISGNTIGGMGGRIISGFIADLWGWRYSYLVMGMIGLISFILFLIFLPDSNHFQRKPFLINEAMKELISHWQNPILRQAYYIAGIIYFIFMGVFNYIGFYLSQAPYFLSTTVIGFLFISYLAGTFSSTYSGKLEGKLTIPVRIFLGLVIIFIGLVLMLFPQLPLILIGLVVLVFGFFFTHAASSSWVSHHAKKAKASASALYLLSYYLGASIGSTLLGYIWQPFGWKGVIIATFVFILLAMGVARRMNTADYLSQSHCSTNSSTTFSK
ncbi:MFS transporter [Tepidibacillus sp. HK-1]|uniref:MFS transporter n=1 Tax=Tepidibacillus sp. HK-1 TaxID=1883407 RepID=UPI0008533FA0|nr:MFS transporter [Tepidibacillus sp. HK-1]GBF10704.1 inner membrane transport protein YnfM [Tepidibacillus sp. HK-1]